jgi:hypothetical protein
MLSCFKGDILPQNTENDPKRKDKENTLGQKGFQGLGVMGIK